MGSIAEGQRWKDSDHCHCLVTQYSLLTEYLELLQRQMIRMSILHHYFTDLY